MASDVTISHGGSLDQWLKHYPDTQEPWIDLSTGVSPWPYPICGQTLAQSLQKLPEQVQIDACRAAMADAFGCGFDNVLPVAGTELMINMLPDLLRMPLVVDPLTYPDYRRAWDAAGLGVTLMSGNVSENHCRVVCNPNNPDGRVITRTELLAAMESSGSWLVVDEAYGELQPEHSLTRDAGRENLIVLRSFGKFYGLPGLRLGAVLAPSAILELLRQRLGHWHVSSLSLEVGAQAYRDRRWQQEHRSRLRETAAAVVEELRALGIQLQGYTDLFFLLSIPNAHALWDHLMKAGIYTRHFAEHPSLLRIGLPADAHQHQRLFSALRLYLDRYAGDN